jgi:hypothetical protein
MPFHRRHRARPALERLELRLALSTAIPANSIGTSVATVTRAGQVSSTSVAVAPKNLTQIVNAVRHFRSARIRKLGVAPDRVRGGE